MFGLKNRKKTSPFSLPTLKKISDERLPVRMEVTSALVRFNTLLSLKRGVVIVSKPLSLDKGLNKGTQVRFKIPWEPEYEVQMSVLLPLLNLGNGGEAFLCQTPAGNAHAVRRKHDRFDTRRYRNLYLEMPALKDRFPIVDISSAGCRVEADAALLRESFKTRYRIWQGAIKVGNQVEIELNNIMPKVFLNNAVGMSFSLGRDARHQAQWSSLLGLLSLQELTVGTSSL